LAVIALGVAAAACTHLPAQPQLIPPGAHWSGGISVGRLYAPATAVVRSPSTGEVTFREKWEDDLSPGLTTIFDPRVQAKWAVAERLYLGGELSWGTVGVALNYVPVPSLVFTLGTQTDGPLMYYATRWPGVAWEGQASALVQPIIGGRVQLLAGAGLSFGAQRRTVQAISPVGNLGIDQVIPSELRVLRCELRADFLAGVAVMLGSRASLLLAVQPFFLLGDPSAPEAVCADCVPDVTLVSYSSSWGMAPTISLIVWD
jgi:hypothetical protein